MRRPSHRPLLALGIAPGILAMLVLLVPASSARAQAWDPNACDAPGDSPNVIVGDLLDLERWGHVGDITGFSVGTYSCNIGTCWLDWITGGGDNRHPTIGQNMFRLKSGRFEQVGQSWLKHGFYALSDNLCRTGCLATDGEHLGVNCADPYVASLNGSQGLLGPKFEVNPTIGFHPHPVSMQGLTGDEIFKRLQVHDADLDPARNPGARYFVEGQYVAQDDAAAGNQHDNASYREVTAFGSAGNFDITFAGTTQRTRPGIMAWVDIDPTVQVRTVDDMDGGRFYVAVKVTDLGGGRWHYEYAVQNLDSHRSGAWFAVPVSSSVSLTNIGFHDVDYHSGEPFDLSDWGVTQSVQGSVIWSTVPYATNPDANALRWGTLYNFRFDADAPPTNALVSIGLFRPGAPGDPGRLVVPLIAPDSCNGDGACDAGESCFSCPTECTGPGPDNDGDGLGYCADCDDNNPGRWSTPGEASGLLAHRGAAGEVILDWSEPNDPGATVPTYEALRSGVASNFLAAPACLRAMDPTIPELTDVDAPTAGPLLFYLVRARSTCAIGVGTTGGDSFGRERTAGVCP